MLAEWGINPASAQIADGCMGRPHNEMLSMVKQSIFLSVFHSFVLSPISSTIKDIKRLRNLNLRILNHI